VYIADVGYNMVFGITPDGVLHVVAGNGVQGFSGDGGKATNASLNQPVGLAADSAGNLFISDNGNARIRKVSPTGVITTIAGNGNRPFSGDNGPATQAGLVPVGLALDSKGNLFFADSQNSRIRRIDTAGIILTIAGNGI